MDGGFNMSRPSVKVGQIGFYDRLPLSGDNQI